MYKIKCSLLNIIHSLFCLVMLSFSISSQADQTDELIGKLMAERNIPGLQLAVVKNGKIIKTGNYGQSNLQDKIAVQSNTLFPINSMTKAFTGVALIQLVEKGLLSIDDPIGKHLPNLPEKWKTLKIKQLMAHTSGLPKILSGRLVDLIVLGDQDASWEKVQKLPFISEPNTEFFYNQTGYVVIGKIIDKYVEKGFPEFITEKQFNVVGMDLTAKAGFDYLEYVVPNQARQYLFAGENKYKNFYGEFPYIMRTAAGMSSTASELAQFLIALESGKLVGNLNLLWTPVTLNNGKTGGFNDFENGYAMGWQVIDRPKHRAISASGGNAVTMIHYPEDHVSVVVLTNLIGALPIQFVDKIAEQYIEGFNL
ncbi:serine hydrolase [Aliikangiella sp. G2MR2-5]|uniref:serine hydrolase domain-containing protein n=1 Tax=Aliikangiella sp. G2MR2-5 TaxID=2788943 RepID=UPI0018A95F8D|nr:serine hydrolase domain-containing protein [Aliikangiella sp. G2MR2-5]